MNDAGDVIPDENDDDSTIVDDDLVDEIIDLEAQKRLWVRAIVPLLQLTIPADSDGADEKVVKALCLMKIAAAQRVARILRSDMVDDRSA